ncbi:MAG TPA: KTSC domain-containing protein [Candidatus Limnocylindria bacterium]|nr:KTSC domain-containing protein [Candidatus Limnocylindria bacterium]
MAYDSRTALLEITFHDGDVYAYFVVPPSVFKGLIRATSPGAFFHEYIDRQFGYELRRSG